MKINSKKMIIITLVVLIIGLLVVSFAMNFTSNKQAQEEAQRQAELEQEQTVAVQTQMQKVVVLTQDVASRSTITAEMLEIQELPAEYIHPMAIVNTEDAINKLTLIPLNAGEQLLSTKIANPDTDYLSYMLKEGYVAYSVPISELTTASGMIRVGDKIHVLGEFDAGTAGEDIEHFVLTDLTILALGQNMSLNTTVSSGGYSTMTLELLPEQAQKLAWAQSHGSLNYILTSVLSDEENTKVRTITGHDVLGEVTSYQQLELLNSIKQETEAIKAVTQMNELDSTAMSRLKTKIIDNDKEQYDKDFLNMLFNYTGNNSNETAEVPNTSVDEPIVAIAPNSNN